MIDFIKLFYLIMKFIMNIVWYFSIYKLYDKPIKLIIPNSCG